MQQAQYSNPLIYEAFDRLAQISADKVRMEAELRDKAIRNRISELSAAMEEGIENRRKEGEINMIEKLIHSGTKWQFIEEVLGYDQKRFNQLKKSYQYQSSINNRIKKHDM